MQEEDLRPKPKPKPSTRPVASKMQEEDQAYRTSLALPHDTLQLCAILLCVRERRRESARARERERERVCVCVKERERVCVCV